MRFVFVIIFSILILALLVCAITAWRSKKSIGVHVSLMLYGLIPPVTGNMIIIASSSETISKLGYYVYFLGMDFMMLMVINFTFRYCGIHGQAAKIRVLVHALMSLDFIQYLLNPFFHHAFDTQPIMVDGRVYHDLISHWGQTYHRVMDYGIFFAMLFIFAYKGIKSPRIYAERYYVILTSMILGGIAETIFIFTDQTVDIAMIVFAVYGFLVFYFSLYYRPMRLLDRMLANIASEMPEALFFFDANNTCIWANEPAIRLANLREGMFEKAAPQLKRIFGSLQQKPGDWKENYVSGEGEKARYFELEQHMIRNKKESVDGYFLSVRDRTEEQNALQKERFLATHDRLTGLYNREYLYEKIRERLKKEPDRNYVVAYIDIKDFKLVNDIFGNEFGDFALKQLANRLRVECSRGTIYGRLVSDTFGICMPEERLDTERFAQIMSRFVVKNDDRSFDLITHMGIYKITDATLDPSVMFDRARMAMSSIKDDYRSFVAIYDDEMRKKVLWERHISTQLDQAIQEKQLVPYLQPIVNASGKIVGAEALVRWIHPEDGFLSPGAFIPVFEKNGMIAQVDQHMWRETCQILARWKEEGRDLFLSVNISPQDFYFMNVESVLCEMVRKYGVETGKLRLEITETVMMTDEEKRIRILDQLREDGFIVEMDDFGSGYSSMNLLKDIHIDVLKIDMAFLKKSENDQKAKTILHSIIHMSDALGITALTEGVESEDQYLTLTGMGCSLFQGYYFSKPVPVEEFEAMVDQA